MARKRNFKAISNDATSQTKDRKTRKLTSKILKTAYVQQKEINDEEISQTIPISPFFKETLSGFEDFNEEDVNEESQEFCQQEDVPSEEEDKLLDAFFHMDGASIAKRLSDTINCIKEIEDKDITATDSETEAIDACQRMGKVMSLYTKGKMPKALSDGIRQDNKNWVGVLKMCQPENWSPSAIFKATNMFVSSSSNDEAERFYEFILLPRIRQDIRNHKKLPFSLCQSLKKILFKPKGFFNGILIPLCKSGTCTNREAVIIGSIMQKVKIIENFSSPALVCLAKMKFLGTTSFFMKVILEKKYKLSCRAIDAVANHFLRFHEETTVMPVIWHQTLLSFVQLYKDALSEEDKKSLKSLLQKQYHKLITPDVSRELDSSRNRGEKEEDGSHLASTINIKPIKEDWFDMPEVPMEEDY